MRGEVLRIPLESTTSHTVMGAEAKANRKGLSAEAGVANHETLSVIGNKAIGLYLKFGVTVDNVSAEAKVKDANVEAGVGASAGEANAAVGLNILGLRIGFKGEVRLGAEAGFEAGANGVKVDTGPTTEGIDWGLAAGKGENPALDWAEQELENASVSFGQWFSQMRSGGLGSWAAHVP